jgi:hypothetical protein
VVVVVRSAVRAFGHVKLALDVVIGPFDGGRAVAVNLSKSARGGLKLKLEANAERHSRENNSQQQIPRR